jgi:hypothetical protein
MLLKHLVFEIVPQEDGTWTAVGIGDDIFTQGSDFEDLKVNALEAVRAHFYDEDCDKFEVRLAQVMSQFVFAAWERHQKYPAMIWSHACVGIGITTLSNKSGDMFVLRL